MDRKSEIRRIVEEIISEMSSDNSGNRPHTSVSGEPSTSHLGVQSQPSYESDSSFYVLLYI